SSRFTAHFRWRRPRGPVSKMPHPHRPPPGRSTPRILFRLLRFARGSFHRGVLVGRLAHELPSTFLSLFLPPLDVRLDPRPGSALGLQPIFVRFPDDVPVPKGLLDLVGHV